MITIQNPYRLGADPIPTGNLIRYYRFNNDVADEVGLGDGTATNITYVTGSSGEAGNFNGSSSNVVVSDSDDLSFTDGVNDKSFSISVYLLFNDSTNAIIIGKIAANREWSLDWEQAGSFYFKLYTSVGSVKIGERFNFNPTASQWYHITVTYDSSKTNAGMKLYLDGVIQSGTSANTGTYTGMVNGTEDVIIGKFISSTNFTLDGALDGLGIWNKELSQTEVTAIYNKQNAGNEIL